MREIRIQVDAGKNGGQFLIDAATRRPPELAEGVGLRIFLGAFILDEPKDLSDYNDVTLSIYRSQYDLDAAPLVTDTVEIDTALITTSAWNAGISSNAVWEISSPSMTLNVDDNTTARMFLVITANTDTAPTVLGMAEILVRGDQSGHRAGVGLRGDWVTDTSYSKNDLVRSSAGDVYFANHAHTSDEDNEPGAGDEWEDVWTLFMSAVAMSSGAVMAIVLAADGALSGLDADLLDGQQGSFYASVTALAVHAALTSGTHGISAFAATFLDDADAAAVRTTLGLGTAATQAMGAFATAAQGTAADAAKTKTDFLTVTQPVDLDAIEARVNFLDAVVILAGTWDASGGTFPGSGTAQAGYSYIVSNGGTVNGVTFVANDRIVAIIDNASTSVYASNWHKLDYTDQVLSVAGRTGAITLALADIGDAGNSASRNVGTTAGTVCAGDDSRLSDSRTPTAHATSHKSGGGDAIKLDELAAPTDVTTLNATTGLHGLLKKLSGNTAEFLRGDGNWAVPPLGAPSSVSTTITSSGDLTSGQLGTFVPIDSTGGAIDLGLTDSSANSTNTFMWLSKTNGGNVVTLLTAGVSLYNNSQSASDVILGDGETVLLWRESSGVWRVLGRS